MRLNIAPLTISAIVALSIGAFAQAPPPTSHIPQPHIPQAPNPEPQPPAPQPTTNGTRASHAEPADAPTLGQLTISGCIEREADYRAAHDQGKGGPGGSGLGQGNEYVVTHATTGGPVPTSGSGITESLTYLLTGSAEKDAGQFIHQRVELTGRFKDSNAEVKRTNSGHTDGAATTNATENELNLRVFDANAVRVSEGTCS